MDCSMFIVHLFIRIEVIVINI